MWGRDLDAFLEALQKQEEIDERDRSAHKGMKASTGGKKVRKRAAAPKKDKNEPMKNDSAKANGKKVPATKKAKPAPPAKSSPT